MPEISVIVPVYKVEEYLDECINSILNQSFKDYELILVDDGSPDHCGDICEKYAAQDRRIKVIHQENKGLSGARNAGLEIASGNYITFIDSDDVVERDYLQTLYSALKKEKAEISCCNTATFSEACTFEKGERESNNKCISISGQDAALMQYEYNPHRAITISAWGKLIEKHLFGNLRFPEGKIHEDQAVIPIILSKAQKVVACSLPLYGYRVRTGSIMHSQFSINRYDDILAIDNCIKYFREKEELEIADAADKRKRGTIAFYSLLARHEGIYDKVPKLYKMSKLQAIKYLRGVMPYDMYEYYMALINPRLVFIESRMRKLRKILGLKVKE